MEHEKQIHELKERLIFLNEADDAETNEAAFNQCRLP
jgi:hypothetical protein